MQKGEHVKDNRAKRSNVEVTSIVGGRLLLRTSGVIVHLAPGASRQALGYVRSNFWHTHTLGTRTAETKKKRKKIKAQRKKEEK